MEGNVYWTRFLDWFGKARECFLVNLLLEVNMPEFLMEKNMAIVTCDIQVKFIKSAFFTDQVQIKIKAEKVENCSAILKFEIVNKISEEILNQGAQKLAFVNIKTRKPVRIPKEIKEEVDKYLLK